MHTIGAAAVRSARAAHLDDAFLEGEHPARLERELGDDRDGTAREPMRAPRARRVRRPVEAGERTRGAGHLVQRFDGVEHAEHARRIAGVNHVEVNVADAPIVEDEPADLGGADGQRAAVPHGRVAERGTEDGEGGELEAHRARSLA